jgi:hypothetical protein
MQELIQDNDNYKPHAKYFSNLSMFIHFVGFITAWKKTRSHRTFSQNYSLTEEDHTAVL